MKLVSFRVTMYKSVIDSGEIVVSPLTVLVGKNESGKTSTLKALHKLNPFRPEPYEMAREWPRGHRKGRDENQVVCSAEFELSQEEIADLSEIAGQQVAESSVTVTRDYSGQLEVSFPPGMFADKLHPNDVDEACASLPALEEPIGDQFRELARKCKVEARRLAYEGRFTELAQLQTTQGSALQQAFSPGNPQPQHSHEQNYINQYVEQLKSIANRLESTPSIQEKAHEYIVTHMPTFIYMSDYRAFSGGAQLDQVKARKDRNQLTEDDKTLLMIMELAGLDLETEVRNGASVDREQRQYDLDDASATLTQTISDRWKQRRYEVEFRADGQSFYTFVKDERDPSLIRLEERSKGFQWFFSFDLMFMYESNGTFKNCVILLDEPGLHLHPDAQRDLLRRMEAYAKGNMLVYTTHLPFMIDLREPDRIRVLSETPNGTVVTDDLTQTQPEAKLVLQAALGMSGSTSYLLSQQNLVVEGVDDYWIVTELSNLLERSGETHLDDDIFVTPAGGASEAAYIATFMIGQGLDVAVLLDSDKAGNDARDALVKKWLTHYSKSRGEILSLGTAIGNPDVEFSIEDLFPDEFYLAKVNEAYKKELMGAKLSANDLRGNDQLCKRVERTLGEQGVTFNKGRVAKLLKHSLSTMKSASALPVETKAKAEKLFTAVNRALPGKVTESA